MKKTYEQWNSQVFKTCGDVESTFMFFSKESMTRNGH